MTIFLFSLVSFLLALALGYPWATWLYKHKMGKQLRTEASAGGGAAPITRKLQKEAGGEGTATMGGFLTIFVATIVGLSTYFFFPELRDHFSDQILFPILVILAYAVVGFIDDLNSIEGKAGKISGASAKFIFWALLGIAITIAAYGYFGLDQQSIRLPGGKNLILGLWWIPLVAWLDAWTVNATRITDGIDGFAPGLMIIAFAAFGAIALFKGIFLAGLFCFILAGAVAGYLWHNAPPARFFNGATGAALGGILVVMSVLTDSLFVLPIIAALIWLDGFSSFIQILSKKYRNGKKIFPVAPVHYTFLLAGISREKFIIRAWLLGLVFAIAGVFIAIL